MNATQGRRTTSLHRGADAVFAAALKTVEGDEYQVLDLRRTEREVTFTRRTSASAAPYTYRVSVEELADGAELAVAFSSPSAVAPSRDDRREGRETADRVLDEVRAAMDRQEPTAAEAEMLGLHLGASGKQFLADLTGRRAWLAALVLLGAYLVPALVAWGIAEASQAHLLGDSVWLAPTLALVLGLGLVVGLTIRFGGWFQAVEFGEEYMLSFRPIAGFVLGWWRLAVQLGGGFLVIMIGSDAENQVTLEEISNAETAALPSYAERAPIPEGWELFSDSTSQNEYDERPNAAYTRTYVVPASYGLTDVETWLQSPGWADGVDAMPPFGALREIECEAEFVTCDGEVTPPVGEPVEYSVGVRLDETNVDQDGEPVPAGLLRLEVEYEKDDSR